MPMRVGWGFAAGRSPAKRRSDQNAGLIQTFSLSTWPKALRTRPTAPGDAAEDGRAGLSDGDTGDFENLSCRSDTWSLSRLGALFGVPWAGGRREEKLRYLRFMACT